MCGIAGIYRVRGTADDATTVRRMLARLTRRGPDADPSASRNAMDGGY